MLRAQLSDGVSLGIQVGSPIGAKVGIHMLLDTTLIEHKKYKFELLTSLSKVRLITNIKTLNI